MITFTIEAKDAFDLMSQVRYLNDMLTGGVGEGPDSFDPQPMPEPEPPLDEVMEGVRKAMQQAWKDGKIRQLRKLLNGKMFPQIEPSEFPAIAAAIKAGALR